MSDISRLNSGGSIRLNTQNQHTRQTPRNDFGSMVRRGVAGGAGAMGQAAGVAAPFIPGAAVVSASMEQVAGAVAPGQGQGQVGNYQNGTLTVPGNAPGTQTGAQGQAAQGSGNAAQDLINQTKELQEMQMSFNLQYLNLQEKMQNENRQFSTVSNVLKTKHDTAKNAINNVR